MEDLHSFVELDQCAARMGITKNQVLDLVRRRVLRAVDFGYGLIYVQPVILSGAIPDRD